MKNRIENVSNLLDENNIDALLITSPANVQYLTGVLSFPLDEQDAWVLITKKEGTVFTDMRYVEHVQDVSRHMNVVELSSSLTFFDALEKTLKNEKLKKMGFESHHLTYFLHQKLKSFEPIDFVPVDYLIENIRRVKDRKEIESITNACNLTDLAFSHIVRHVKSGVTEKELAYKLEMFIKKNGGELAFPSIVAFGPHSAIPHHSPTQRSLSYSDGFVLFDLGAKVDGYASDMTRTVLTGSPSKKMIEMYETTKQAQALGIEQLNGYSDEHFKSSTVAKKVNAFLTKEGYSDVPHGLGHGVGIQVHELPALSPKIDSSLHEGNVITVEPGIYISGFGGVRIEDTVLLENDSATPLTESTKELQTLKI